MASFRGGGERRVEDAVTLLAAVRSFLEENRRAVLVTLAPDSRPLAVPICYAVVEDALVTPLDEKPKKAGDPLRLRRVRDILEDPRVVVLVDRWDERWDRLAWLRIEGRAEIVDRADGIDGAVPELRRRYPQYHAMDLGGRPVIRIAAERLSSWGDLRPD